jgi:tetratricopeptide (TPR) repeat protein
MSLKASNDLMRGEPVRAEKAMRDLVARGPARRDYHYLLALILAEQGRYREALPIAEKVVGMYADRETYGLLAWVLVAGELDVERGIAAAEAGRAIPPEVKDKGRYPVDPPPEHALGLARLKHGRRFKSIWHRLGEAASPALAERHVQSSVFTTSSTSRARGRIRQLSVSSRQATRPSRSTMNVAGRAMSPSIPPDS